MLSQPVYVFVQPGCPACEAFKPKLDKLAGEYEARGVKTVTVDLSSEDPQVQALADRHHVEATPTIVVAGKKREGNLSAPELRGLYDSLTPRGQNDRAMGAAIGVGLGALALLGLGYLIFGRGKPKRSQPVSL